tara:strand:+ start:442 stop:630 length:189 start_codon:yes stop_codon:yes gene_type:complete
MIIRGNFMRSKDLEYCEIDKSILKDIKDVLTLLKKHFNLKLKTNHLISNNVMNQEVSLKKYK